MKIELNEKLSKLLELLRKESAEALIVAARECALVSVDQLEPYIKEKENYYKLLKVLSNNCRSDNHEIVLAHGIAGAIWWGNALVAASSVHSAIQSYIYYTENRPPSVIYSHVKSAIIGAAKVSEEAKQKVIKLLEDLLA